MKPLTEALDGEFFPIVFDRDRNVFHIENPTKDDNAIARKVAKYNSGNNGRWMTTNSESVKFAEMARARFQNQDPERKLVRSTFADDLEYADVTKGKSVWFT